MCSKQFEIGKEEKRFGLSSLMGDIDSYGWVTDDAPRQTAVVGIEANALTDCVTSHCDFTRCTRQRLRNIRAAGETPLSCV